jgi:hypothetical protein
VIGQDNLAGALDRLDLTQLMSLAQPRITYNDAETSRMISGRVELRGQVYVVASAANIDSHFMDKVRGAHADLYVAQCVSYDPYQSHILRAIYPIPLRAIAAYDNDAWSEYYSSPALHVFAAEQRAVVFEQSRVLSDRRVRLAPGVVEMLDGEDFNLAELLGLCWIYGLLQINTRSGYYQLALADGEEPDPFFTGQRTPPWEALYDAMAHRNPVDHLAPLSRTNRSRTLRRIGMALQRKRDALSDRVQRNERFDKFRREHLQLLRQDSMPARARDLAEFMDALLERERR